MSAKKKIIVLAAASAILLVTAACLLYKMMPSFRKADLAHYYGAEEGKATLFCNDTVREEKAVIKDGKYYIPLELAAGELNSRFYWDEESEAIRYVLPEGILTVKPGQNGCELDGEEERLEYAPLIEQNGERFLELEFICRYTALEYEIYEDPVRIWLWNRYDTPVIYATAAKGASIRTLPAIKAPIVTKIKKGEPLLIAEESGSWYRVMGADGHCGYVKKSAFSETAETVRSGEWFQKQDYQTKSLGEPVILGWNYIDDISYGLDSLEYHLSRMKGVNVIAPTWFTLSDQEGGFQSRADKNYVEKPHENGLQVWALTENISIDVDELALFSSAKARRTLIDGLLAEVREFGIDGINLDMESLNETVAPHYLQFIRELSVECRKADIYLSVDNYVPMPYNTYYNLAEQGEVVDYVIIMGYDQSWSEPGPNASLEFVQNAVENAMKQVRTDKLIQAVPFYSRLWSQNEDGTWKRTTADMARCEELLAECGDAQWLEEEGCYYGTVTEDGTEYQLWFEESRSMRARLELLAQYELGGIAGWRLGFETPEVWELVKELILRGM